MAKVKQHGIKALQETGAFYADVLADMAEGTLAGINAQGKLVPATNVTGGNIKAVTVIIEGSEQKFGEAFDIMPNRPLRTKRGQTVEKYFILEDSAITFADLGKPVYLATAGGYTTTVPVGAGVLKQIVGQVLAKGQILIDLTRDPAGVQL